MMPGTLALWPPLAAWYLLAGFGLAALCFAAAALLARRAAAPVAGQGAARPEPAASLSRRQPEGRQTATMSEQRRQLMQAGFDHPDALRHFMQAKVTCLVLGLVLGALATVLIPALQPLPPVGRAALSMTLGLIGFTLPTWYVDRRRAIFRRNIERAIPDALDFMLICVEAGQSMDTALLRVSQELKDLHPDLAERFLGLTETLSAGGDRLQAFHKLAEETDNDDLRQFATIVVQATTMGTPVSHTLRVFAADLRDRRVRQTEERANTLPTKMTLGTMLFTVPPLLILLLAPPIARLIDTM